MNYRYKIDNDSFILSSEEHAKVQEAIRQGGKFIVLRAGAIGLNTSYCKFFRPTDDATEKQEQEKYAQLGGETNEGSYKINRKDFMKKVLPKSLQENEEPEITKPPQSRDPSQSEQPWQMPKENEEEIKTEKLFS